MQMTGESAIRMFYLSAAKKIDLYYDMRLFHLADYNLVPAQELSFEIAPSITT